MYLLHLGRDTLGGKIPDLQVRIDHEIQGETGPEERKVEIDLHLEGGQKKSAGTMKKKVTASLVKIVNMIMDLTQLKLMTGTSLTC